MIQPPDQNEPAASEGLSPLVLWEDDDLLVLDKPAGMNTHAPAPFLGDGLYEWCRAREPRWASLGIVHRLDKETSGVIVFSKSSLAARELVAQFSGRGVDKTYLLATDRPVPASGITVRKAIRRVGDRYHAVEAGQGGDPAETAFRLVRRDQGLTWVEAMPKTGRTHQIRIHAAVAGFPILGDVRYAGTPAPRLFLHAARLGLTHPGSGKPVAWTSEFDPAEASWAGLRRRLVFFGNDRSARLIHGAGDGHPGVYADQYGAFVLLQSERRPEAVLVDQMLSQPGVQGVYWKEWLRSVRGRSVANVSPVWVAGERAEERFLFEENGVRYWASFGEGYSVGLFLDQRENRRRLITSHLGPGLVLTKEPGADRPLEVLNTFAYTCGFSVAAARGGAHTASVDLSAKYLAWGRANFECNGIDPAGHEFYKGDVFDWMKRFARKGRLFDIVILDPPTFSQSDQSGLFRAERDYGRLMQAALPLVRRGGWVLASTNAARLTPPEFMETLTLAVAAAGRRLLKEQYVPQPPDFPITREEPGHLKTVWMQVG